MDVTLNDSGGIVALVRFPSPLLPPRGLNLKLGGPPPSRDSEHVTSVTSASMAFLGQVANEGHPCVKLSFCVSLGGDLWVQFGAHFAHVFLAVCLLIKLLQSCLRSLLRTGSE